MQKDILNILIGGEAGQGLVTVGQLLAKALVRSGYEIVVTQSYQSRIRGGHNTFAIRVGRNRVYAPQEEVDLLVAFDEETVSVHRLELSAKGLILAGVSMDVPDGIYLKVPYEELAKGRYQNVVALGVVSSLLGLRRELVTRTVEDLFGKKHPEAETANRQALEAAYAWAEGQSTGWGPLEPVLDPPKRLMMNGNEAIALGAMSAGAKFCAFYPMTPSTSIALSLAANAERMGLVVEQAEDEIAAINMALGASFAGAPSIVPTSGGGFALMAEGVSLAAMTETPVVIVLAQRPGPATGLPTRTEQGDLEFVLHAGHGEFPRAIFAPGTVEECFYFTRLAFEFAERYQGPMFLLTDQFLADSYRAVASFDLVGTIPVRTVGLTDPVEEPYRRYAITENGVSPRLLPGASRHLVVADSDEHTEDGHMTEDLAFRRRIVEKRLRKGEGLRADALGPEFVGDKAPEIVLVTWGSSKGAVLEAAARIRSGGTRVATLHFGQVWPLAPETFLKHLEGAREVISVEGNVTGQFARLIRRETGFLIEKRVLRYDGLPITPEFILRQVSS